MAKTIATEIEVKEFAIGDLDEASYNPRFMPEEHRRGLAEAVEHFGVLRLPVVNARHERPRLVSGHQLVRDLRAKGFTHVECAVVRFDETAEQAANLALNNHAIQGSYDPASLPALERLAKKLVTPDFTRVESALVEVREAAARFKAAHAQKAEDSEEVEESAEVADSKVGVTYQLGDHRLYCGDFRDGVVALLPKHYADACVTDPPYNIAYTSGKRFRKDKLREPIEGDDQAPEEWASFVKAVANTLLDSVKGPMYVFMSAQELPSFEAAWVKAKGVVHRWLVAAKSAHPLSPADYHPQYELCLYGARKDVRELPYYGAEMPNVIETVRPSKNALHSMQKPVELIRQLLQNSTDVGECVLDPFAGSGTTLVVCEELARVCMAVEISPVHCDTIRRRWATQVHGKDADWKTLTPASR